MTRRRWIADTFTETTASLTRPASRTSRTRPARTDRHRSGHRRQWPRLSRRNRTASALKKSSSRSSKKSSQSRAARHAAARHLQIRPHGVGHRKSHGARRRRIVPVIARRTEKHLAQAADKRVERWRRIAHEAAKQSRRADLPTIEDPSHCPRAATEPSSAQHILLPKTSATPLCASASKQQRFDRIRLASNFEFAIGPEGGWTTEELALFKTQLAIRVAGPKNPARRNRSHRRISHRLSTL
jgi:16S rRNA (uracil1498-N3)-methyltransferase